MAMLRILDPMYGDKKVHWKEDNTAEIKKAKTLFDEKIGLGWLAFKVLKDKTSKMIKKFDPKAAMIVLTPPIRGG